MNEAILLEDGWLNEVKGHLALGRSSRRWMDEMKTHEVTEDIGVSATTLCHEFRLLLD